MDFIFAMAPQGGDGGGGFTGSLIMMAAIFAIFYFMILRPQQRRMKEREQMLSNVQKGDKIITSGGVHGTVVGVEDKTIILQVTDNVKLKVEKSAVASVVK